MQFCIFEKKRIIMEVISAREFRSNQGKFLTAARNGQSVLLKSRYGVFKIVPVGKTDRIVEEDIIESINEVKADLKGQKSLTKARDVRF